MPVKDRNHGDSGERKHKLPGVRTTYDLSSQDGQKILEVIDAITSNGGAIRIGRARDGGALALGVYGDGQSPYTDYLRPGEGLLEYLNELRAAAFTPEPVTRKAPK